MAYIVKAVFGSESIVKTDTIYQYNSGQVLQVEGLAFTNSTEFHLAIHGKDTASIITGTIANNIAKITIPEVFMINDFCTCNYRIDVFVYVIDNDSGYTKYKIIIPVKSRPRPKDYYVDLPTVPELKSLKQELNTAVNNFNDAYTEIDQLKSETASLKEDIDYKIGKTAVGERELKFTNIGYVYASDGTISSSKDAQNTGFCRIDGASRIIAHVNLSEAGAKIAFYSQNKEYLKDISVIPTATDPNYTEIDLDISSDKYTNAKYCIISNYGNDKKMAKLVGAVAPIEVKEEVKQVKEKLKILEETSITTNDISIKIDDNGNVFNKNSVVVGKEVYHDGSISNEPNSAISDYIPVYGKKMIFLNNLPVYNGLGHYSRFYDENKNPIGENINSVLSQFSVKVPTNAHFFVFSVYQRWTSGSKDYSNVVVSFNGYQEYSEYSEIVKSIKGYKIPQKAINNVKTTDKKMLIFGDSITETASMDDDGSNYTEGVRTNWMTFANIMLNTANFKNYAKSGAGWHDRSGLAFRQNVSEQIQLAINDSANDDAEIIVCSLGTNDGSAGSSTYEEAMDKTSIDSLDRTKLYEGIRWAMWTLRNKYPNAVCFCATPIQRASAEQESSLIEAITKMAHRYNFIIIDAYNESGIVRDFETVDAKGRYLYDGLHPNEDGAKKMAKLYANVILRNFIVD